MQTRVRGSNARAHNHNHKYPHTRTHTHTQVRRHSSGTGIACERASAVDTSASQRALPASAYTCCETSPCVRMRVLVNFSTSAHVRPACDCRPSLQLDYDYSPVSTFVSYDGSSRRIYMNISQEGKAAIDELREQKLINGLKISTEDFQPITAYQVAAVCTSLLVVVKATT